MGDVRASFRIHISQQLLTSPVHVLYQQHQGMSCSMQVSPRLTMTCSIFPSHHIEGVGTLQDAGLLENDPELWARSEVSALFPHLEGPDFVVSLGTGEPVARSYDVSTEDLRHKGMLRRIWHLLCEKSRDKSIRRASTMAKSTSYRLNIDFDGDEPRLDDASSIPKLISRVQADVTLCPKIDAVTRRMVASLFYFQLDLLPCICENDKYLFTGKIMCSIRQQECDNKVPDGRKNKGLQELLAKLTSARARFAVDGSPIACAVTGRSFVGEDGNFEIPTTAKTSDGLAITLEMDGAEACDISGSPYSIQNMITVQGLNAPFGRSDHRKRKRSDDDANVITKKRKVPGA
jgi:hypothetical protein